MSECWRPSCILTSGRPSNTPWIHVTSCDVLHHDNAPEFAEIIISSISLSPYPPSKILVYRSIISGSKFSFCRILRGNSYCAIKHEYNVHISTLLLLVSSLYQFSLVSFYSTQKVAGKFPAIGIALIFMIETWGLLLTGACFLCSWNESNWGLNTQQFYWPGSI